MCIYKTFNYANLTHNFRLDPQLGPSPYRSVIKAFAKIMIILERCDVGINQFLQEMQKFLSLSLFIYLFISYPFNLRDFISLIIWRYSDSCTLSLDVMRRRDLSITTDRHRARAWGVHKSRRNAPISSGPRRIFRRRNAR